MMASMMTIPTMASKLAIPMQLAVLHQSITLMRILYLEWFLDSVKVPPMEGSTFRCSEKIFCRTRSGLGHNWPLVEESRKAQHLLLGGGDFTLLNVCTSHAYEKCVRKKEL